MRIWPWVFDCFLGVSVYREACYITSVPNRTRTAHFSDEEISPPAIWNFSDNMDCCKPTPQFGVIGSCHAESVRAGMREVKRSSISRAMWGSWQAPSSLRAGIPLPSLSWEVKSAVEQRANKLSKFLTSMVLHQTLIKDIHPPTKWVNERLIDDSEVYLFKLLFICSYTTTFWTCRKSSNSVPRNWKSMRWQCTCCNVLIPFKSIKADPHGISFLSGGVHSDFPLEWLLLFCARLCGSMYSPTCCTCFTWSSPPHLGFNETKVCFVLLKPRWQKKKPKPRTVSKYIWA